MVWFIVLFSSKAEVAIPTELPRKYGFSSTLFLSNSSFILLGAVGLAASYLCVSFLSLLSAFPPISAYFRIIREKYRWEYPVQLWLQVYMDVGVNASLQFSAIGSFDYEPILLLNVLIAAIFLAVFVILPFCVMKLLMHHGNKRISVLYSGLKPGIRLYFPLYLFRRLVYALVLLLFGNYPAPQAISSALASTSTLIYLLSYRPYTSRTALLSPLLAETSASLSLCLTCLFLVVPKDSNVGKRLGEAVIGVVVGGVAACAVLAVGELVVCGKEVVTTFRRIAAELKANGQTERCRRAKSVF